MASLFLAMVGVSLIWEKSTARGEGGEDGAASAEYGWAGSLLWQFCECGLQPCYYGLCTTFEFSLTLTLSLSLSLSLSPTRPHDQA